MIRALESTQSELVTLRKQLADAEELLPTRKPRKTGKRVSLQGNFVFSTVEVLGIVQQAEAASAKKKARQTEISRPNCLSATEVKANWYTEQFQRFGKRLHRCCKKVVNIVTTESQVSASFSGSASVEDKLR